MRNTRSMVLMRVTFTSAIYLTPNEAAARFNNGSADYVCHYCGRTIEAAPRSCTAEASRGFHRWHLWARTYIRAILRGQSCYMGTAFIERVADGDEYSVALLRSYRMAT